MTTVFLAGIIQGSIRTRDIHAQDYRLELKDLLQRHLPDATVYCPIEHHPESLNYPEERARRVFFEHVEMAGDSDVVIAFLPEASMGTAVEMWEAHRRGCIVLSVTPMEANWTVRFLSTCVFADLDALKTFVASGELARLLASRGEAGR
jgi:hypothetical protein